MGCTPTCGCGRGKGGGGPLDKARTPAAPAGAGRAGHRSALSCAATEPSRLHRARRPSGVKGAPRSRRRRFPERAGCPEPCAMRAPPLCALSCGLAPCQTLPCSVHAGPAPRPPKRAGGPRLRGPARLHRGPRALRTQLRQQEAHLLARIPDQEVRVLRPPVHVALEPLDLRRHLAHGRTANTRGGGASARARRATGAPLSSTDPGARAPSVPLPDTLLRSCAPRPQRAAGPSPPGPGTAA